MRQRDDRGSLLLRGLGTVAAIALLCSMIGVAAAFAVSVVVQGESMHPGVATGDRIVVLPLAVGDVARFDIVEGSFADIDGSPVIKRVIGLPGDQVTIKQPAGDDPVVLVRPAGESGTFSVDNPRWAGQLGTRLAGCCEATGRAGNGRAAWVTVPPDSYWVIGDNWGGSDDSRTYGFMKSDDIRGVAGWRLLPVSSFGRLAHDDLSLEPVGTDPGEGGTDE